MTERRVDGRRPDEHRQIEILPGFVEYAEGSVLISTGSTRVLCNVSIEEKLPAWMQGQERGWVTAEYSLLPRSTHTRTPRERSRPSGRSQEISRLIGRSLRAAVHLSALAELTCIVDCDVIQADGGTRTAAITGGYVALDIALKGLQTSGRIKTNPLKIAIAAISVGVIRGIPLVDLNYEEDSAAEVDVNMVMTEGGDFIEIQGTSEKEPVSPEMLEKILLLARETIPVVFDAQKKALKNFTPSS